MKKMLALQICALIVVSGSLAGMLFSTEVFNEVHSRIVSVLCLSCLKLEPKTTHDFTFETATDDTHPDFILENLTKGLVFLHFSEDVCHGCEIMHPVIEQLFNIKFEKDEMVYRIVKFENADIIYFYINIDHTTKELRESLPIYDKEHIGGLPMFSIVTLGYDHGRIKPYYTSLYGTLNVDNNDERISLLTELMQESIDVYNQNWEGYDPDQQ